MKDKLLLWAPHAWLNGWRKGVLLAAGTDGRWTQIESAPMPPAGATVLPGPVLPGMVNAHSHAFQRAFAGLAEQRANDHDDFWTWRDRMYRVAGGVSPEGMRAIARQLYCELLLGGYTHVCEFHYLHHQCDGTPHADPLAMSRALLAAAADAGIGITLIPVIYERAGFFQNDLRPDQRPFAMTAAGTWAAVNELLSGETDSHNFAIGAHSLRAARVESIASLKALAAAYTGPIHIHAAEQTGEVDDCLKAARQRPIELLAASGLMDSRWWLVHATHTTPAELDAVAAAGAGVVLCPHTEANLGDGVCDLPGMLARGIPVAIGSDSQIARDWPQELRQMEYAQRLAHRKRCVAADPPRRASTGERLFSTTLAAGAKAAGHAAWGFTPGARADLLVIDRSHSAFTGVPLHALLDALIFSGSGPMFRAVLTAGQWAVKDGLHPGFDQHSFSQVQAGLWGQ